MRRGWLIVPILLAALQLSGQSPGYSVSRTQILANRQIDWQAWEIAEGSADLDSAGHVRPRRLRGQLNASLDADQFNYVRAGNDTVMGGIIGVGTAAESAEFIRDGDLTTGWGPDRGSPLANWFVDLDLGRSVTAERIIVRFAAEGEGDPFLKFRIMASGQSRLTNEDLDIEFFRVGQVNVRNKDVREFEFTIKPQRRVPDGVTGEVIQTVRFEALDTDADRAHEIALSDYLELPADERGATDYFRQTVSGRTILVDRETWEALPADERGPVRYFRWESPRLMELEVITPGQNIVHLTQIQANRGRSAFDNLLRFLTTDGLAQTYYPVRPYDALRHDNHLEIDLGARFWLDRLRLVMQVPLNAYQILLSDGALDPNGDRIWREFEERLNSEQFLQMEERFPLQVVRFIQLRALQLVGTEAESGQLRELQAFGQGYVSDIELTSPIIRLPASSMFTALSWLGESPPDTRVEIRTRSGDDLTVVSRYFDRFEREIGQEQWESARETNRGPVIRTEVPGPLWSNWSELYQASGDAFRSPGPRRYAMVKVRLLSSNSDRHASLRQLRIGLAPPLVDQTFAEMWPIQDVTPGVEQEFDLYLRPQFGAGNPGFDRIRLQASSSTQLELLAARRGTQQDLEFGSGTDLLASGARIERSAEAVDLVLPASVRSGSGIYQLHLRTRLFLAGTTFRAQLLSDDRPGVVQDVSEGDAVSHVISQRMVVITDLDTSLLLQDLRAEPPVLTPNGDGINDETTLRFNIFQLRGAQRPAASIYDLSGRRLRHLPSTAGASSGSHAIVWDGRDASGQVVPPGIYVVRVDVEIDAARQSAATQIVHVVY